MALSFTDQSNETIFVVEKFGRKNKITPKKTLSGRKLEN